jgi:hypothetical protein
MAAQLVGTVGAYSDFSRLTLAYREPMQSARASSADHLFECCDIVSIIAALLTVKVHARVARIIGRDLRISVLFAFKALLR